MPQLVYGSQSGHFLLCLVALVALVTTITASPISTEPPSAKIDMRSISESSLSKRQDTVRCDEGAVPGCCDKRAPIRRSALPNLHIDEVSGNLIARSAADDCGPYWEPCCVPKEPTTPLEPEPVPLPNPSPLFQDPVALPKGPSGHKPRG
jgi:hypothetical protein